MSRITLRPGTDPQAALAVVRETFTSRDYLWEDDGPGRGVAHEGGERITGTTFAMKLRVTAEIDTTAERLELSQDTTGIAMAGAGAPVFLVWLNIRFAKVKRAVRDDLAAAGHR